MFSPRRLSAGPIGSPFSSARKGTPSKRISSVFASPTRRGRDRRSQVGTRSLQVSQILDDTSHHRIESFGVPLPVLITEALTLADRTTEISVNIDTSGWAWLVGGRKLFVWRYKPTATRGIQCKELTLPPSDLAHSADRVCVLAGPGENQPTACVAVSPEGVVRYWPNIAYEASTAEISAELKGEECACVINFQPHGCLLATTTSSLSLLVTSQNSITCTALKTSQGMFSGIGRRVSSLIFGASPAQASEPLIAIVAGRKEEDDDTRSFYVLSDTHLQKWRMSGSFPEKLLYQIDAVRLFKEALARDVWDQDSVQLPQLSIWLMDMQLVSEGVMILGAGVNTEQSPPILHYAVAIVSTRDEQPPVHVDKIIRLAYTEKYEDAKKDELFGYHLLIASPTASEALVYSSHVLFMIPVNDIDGQPADRMDLQSSLDHLIGAGTCDGMALFFSSLHGIFCVVPQRLLESSIMEEMGQEMSTMGYSLLQVAELSQCEDKLSRLKACFITSMTGNQSEVQRTLEELMPPSSLDMNHGDTSREIDQLVTALSSDLIDDYPTADPRWAESSRQDGSSTSSLIIEQQLKDKIRAHDYFRSFLKKFNIWNQLTVAEVRDSVIATRHLLCEHVEKLEAAISLRQQHTEHSRLLEACVRQVLKQRAADVPVGLTPQDVFYREVSKIQDIVPALFNYETESLSSGQTAKQNSQLVAIINSILQSMLTAALAYRQAKADEYQSPDDQNSPMPEYIPWTSTSGNTGMRTILSKQVSITVERAIPETQDVETRGLLFQQILGLADLILEGYSSQLESLRHNDQHSEDYQKLFQKYEEERRKLIEPLLGHEQYDRAASLAEKYFDFDVLITICEATNNQDRLQRYVTQFSDQGFSQFLFNWYLKEGKRGRLLAQPFSQNPELRRFLAAENTRYLSWLHEIGSDDFISAHETLMELSRNETAFLAKKKTLLSLSKLAALAVDDFQDNLETNVEAINEELNLIDLQETMPIEVFEKIGMDSKNMRVMTPSELIRMYVGDQNTDANQVDFKKALDLLEYIDKNSSVEDFEALRQYIWCQAILRDSDRWTDPTENDPIRLREETVFFKTVDLVFLEGEDLGQVLPTVQQLLQAEDLGALRQNTHFQFLLQAAYEVIENVLHSS